MSQVTELNLKNLMETLDDAWNAGPNSPLWDTFRNAIQRMWPFTGQAQPEPTRGMHNHDLEAVEFFKTFTDNHLINRPYKILFAEGNHTCSVADFYGTMKGPMKMPDREISPTGKSFHVEFCTVATRNNKGEITEERLLYHQIGLMRQIGLM